MRIIIIGGVAAGTKAAAKAHRVDPNNEIILYQDEAEVSYSACGLPYVISGVIDDERKVVIRQPEDFAKEGIQVFIRHRVTHIDTARRQLTVKNLITHVDAVVDYDRLILATGACPIVPNVEGITLEGVLTLRNISDLTRFKTVLTTFLPKQAVIIGAGYIGLELAEAFHELAIKITIVEKAARILPKFDAEMAQLVHDHLLENQVKLVLGDGLAKLHGENGKVTAIETESGKMIPADLVVIAIGVKPNVELAKAAGIELGSTGAIAVDSRMETRIPGVFVAGDCCETVNRVTGMPIWMPLGDIANLQGRVAGENVAGGNAHFPGVFGTAIFKTFNLTVAITGLSEQAAQESGFEPVSIVMKGSDRARYYPGRQEFTLKLIADRRDGRLLGAQVIGCGTVDKMVDIAATALLGKLTCADLENADLAYSPPFSPVLSPVIVAAGILNGKLTR
ncbi:FAD-dependent pyridine nucleotide-disulphide oxidoreductase [Crenothrix polyspora]|uniref:FAD-dependent pyridine nucleotide-disulphide oxidoreductase n=1 Tax=Crenothrix polyspora TaxID=360316 RepID=A0A1R4HAX8_9GAMM|nr:FAD-dependent oxidoreductase [Crenothrix polyspora]SJM93020.1 FAD-dependent pyridine nucleotide-disulphide oxidoreductase [Crenothrix polyspora]